MGASPDHRGLDGSIALVRHWRLGGDPMPAISAERALWLAANILPLEAQLRAWLRRVMPRGLDVDVDSPRPDSRVLRLSSTDI